MKRRVLSLIALAAVILTAAVALALDAQNEKPAWDVSYPIVNTNVSWQETFSPGSWGE